MDNEIKLRGLTLDEIIENYGTNKEVLQVLLTHIADLEASNHRLIDGILKNANDHNCYSCAKIYAIAKEVMQANASNNI